MAARVSLSLHILLYEPIARETILDKKAASVVLAGTYTLHTRLQHPTIQVWCIVGVILGKDASNNVCECLQ